MSDDYNRRAMTAGNEDYRFCPRCGGALASGLKDGEPPRLVCAACGFVFYLDPKVAACTICMVDGGIVLLKRSIEPAVGKWVFPGGFVDRGEAVAAAAVRETLEEVEPPGEPHRDPRRVFVPGQRGGGRRLRRRGGGRRAERLRRVRRGAGLPAGEIPWGELAFESTRAALRDYVRRFFPRVRVPR